MFILGSASTIGNIPVITTKSTKMTASNAKSSIPNRVSTLPEKMTKMIPSPASTLKPKPKPTFTRPQLVANSTEVSTTPVFNVTSDV